MRLYWYCDLLIPLGTYGSLDSEKLTLEEFEQEISEVILEKCYRLGRKGNRVKLHKYKLIAVNSVGERELLYKFDLLLRDEYDAFLPKKVYNSEYLFWIFDENLVTWLPTKQGKELVPLNSKENADKIGIEWDPDILGTYKHRKKPKLREVKKIVFEPAPKIIWSNGEEEAINLKG